MLLFRPQLHQIKLSFLLALLIGCAPSRYATILDLLPQICGRLDHVWAENDQVSCHGNACWRMLQMTPIDGAEIEIQSDPRSYRLILTPSDGSEAVGCARREGESVS